MCTLSAKVPNDLAQVSFGGAADAAGDEHRSPLEVHLKAA